MSSKLLEHPQAVCNVMRRIAMQAGEVILDHYDDCGFSESMVKEDGSPVTVADQEAEALIEQTLFDVLPDVPFVGEEAVEEGRIPDLHGARHFWLVDALDGTKEFIRGGENFTVNIALIEDGRPLAGVIYVPVKGELYAGCGAGTAIRYNEDTDTEKSIRVRKVPPGGLNVVSSMSHGPSTERLETFLGGYKVAKLVKSSSSLKICHVAAGKADLYPRLGPTSEWDIAAGEAILRSAGGKLTDLQGNDIQYAKVGDKFLNPEFVAMSGDLDLPFFD